MSGYQDREGEFIGNGGDFEVDSAGGIVMDSTVHTRARILLTGHRGKYVFNKNQGSLWFKYQTLDEAERNLIPDARVALKPLLDSGEILSVEEGAVEVDEKTGTFFGTVRLEVPNLDELVDISGLPIGRLT